MFVSHPFPIFLMHVASRHVGHDEVAQACATLKVIATCSLMLSMHFASRHVDHDEVAQASATLKVIAPCSLMHRPLLTRPLPSNAKIGTPSLGTTCGAWSCSHK